MDPNQKINQKKIMKNLLYLFAIVALALVVSGCSTTNTNSPDTSGGAGANPNVPNNGGAATSGMH